MEPKLPGSNKPIVGMVIVLFTSLFIGGWLYVDSTRGELEMRIKDLTTQVGTLQAQQAARQTDMSPEPGTDSPTPEMGLWDSYDGGDYTIDIPPGYKLSTSENEAYVIADPNPNTEPPFMAIRAIPVSEKAQYEKEHGRVLAGGSKLYWLYTWENTIWAPFEQVVATFKPL